jgi:two-component system response regulator NreC
MKILLCDDHRMLRDGLRKILETAGLEVIGEAANGREVLTLTEQLHPDLVVMDISMPELNGVDATRQLLRQSPNVKVVGLSMNSDRRYVVAMFGAGAVGYLLKSSAAEELIVAVRAVAAGLKYVSPAITDRFVDAYLAQASATEPPPDNPTGPRISKPLSAREREVLQLLAEGKSTKEIATKLEIAPTTVETHRRQIVDKLQIRTIAELTKYAVREGLTTLD